MPSKYKILKIDFYDVITNELYCSDRNFEFLEKVLWNTGIYKISTFDLLLFNLKCRLSNSKYVQKELHIKIFTANFPVLYFQ